jgi:hypothetical protein
MLLGKKPSGKFPEGSKGNALDHIAGFVGVDRRTLGKAEYIVTNAEKKPEKYSE